jgi:tetratricopeptide (TPR) repeat protein
LLKTPTKKQQRRTKTWQSLLSGVLLVAIQACTPNAQKFELDKAQKEFNSKNYKSAIEHYEKLIANDAKSEGALVAAQKIAEISELNTHYYSKALFIYKFIIVNSTIYYERIEAQKKTATVYFNQLADYKQSIIEYSRLLELPHSAKDSLLYRMNLARAYYYQANIFQALVEIDTILKESHDENISFEGMLLKANIFLGAKRINEAVSVTKEIISKYPAKSKAETVPLMLSICYEEQSNFTQAIATLEQLRPDYPNKSFIDKRIAALKERSSLQPGANGLKK